MTKLGTVSSNTDLENILPPGVSLERYVDYVNGNDANDGKAPYRAKKTIQNAYDTLRAYAEANITPAGNQQGVGKINLASGNHDVGAGVLFDTLRPVEMVGLKSGEAYPSLVTGASAKIMSSSAAATELIKINHAADQTQIGYGFRFRDLSFSVTPATNTAMTALIDVHTVNVMEVEWCRFYSTTANSNVVAMRFTSHEDCSWQRIVGNRCQDVAFIKFVTGGQYNRGVIEGNQFLYGGSLPCIHLGGEVQGFSISNNTLDGKSVFALLDNGQARNNQFVKNDAEAADSSNVFYDLYNGASLNIFDGGYCITVDGSNGTWLRTDAASYPNEVRGWFDLTGTAAFKRKIVDGTADANTSGKNVITPISKARVGVYRSGTSPTIADSDLPATPINGAFGGVTHNTSTLEDRFWFRANGIWQSIAAGAGAPADASTTVKGIGKVSVAPVSASNPIAVGDNDRRMMAVYNVKAYGAVGNGSTDDTAAIQAAIDAGGPYSKIYIPASTTAYKFSNLKLYANQQLVGDGMYSTGLNRITGSTGTAIREKTAAEGNAGGATGLWIRDLFVNGNGTAGDGIAVGYQVAGNQLNFGSGLQNVLVVGFPSGHGFKIYQNAAKCSYLWSNSNQYGYRFEGGGGSYEGIWAESNTTYNLWLTGTADTFFHVHCEGSPNPAIRIEGQQNSLFGVDIGQSGNNTNLIDLATGNSQNCLFGVRVQKNGFTLTNLIYNSVWGFGTGSTDTMIPFWADGGNTNPWAHIWDAGSGNRSAIGPLGFYVQGNKIVGARAAANPDTSGATLPQLETEVNELKAMLRTHGLMA